MKRENMNINTSKSDTDEFILKNNNGYDKDILSKKIDENQVRECNENQLNENNKNGNAGNDNNLKDTKKEDAYNKKSEFKNEESNFMKNKNGNSDNDNNLKDTKKEDAYNKKNEFKNEKSNFMKNKNGNTDKKIVNETVNNKTKNKNKSECTDHIVTRFPPEPSGMLHIGHAKALLINTRFARSSVNGKLIIRFDDTNPLKENQDYVDSIRSDITNLLGINPDKWSYTSDYFAYILEFTFCLVKQGYAYLDDTDFEEMKRQRFCGEKSKNRDLDINTNLKIFKRFVAGLEPKYCIRAKIDYLNVNKAMRDPVIYRFVDKVHHRIDQIFIEPFIDGNELSKASNEVVGFKDNSEIKDLDKCQVNDNGLLLNKNFDKEAINFTSNEVKNMFVYPTYDLACPIVDCLEGVTHAFRTNEYRDRNKVYEWIVKHTWNNEKIRNEVFEKFKSYIIVKESNNSSNIIDQGLDMQNNVDDKKIISDIITMDDNNPNKVNNKKSSQKITTKDNNNRNKVDNKKIESDIIIECTDVQNNNYIDKLNNKGIKKILVDLKYKGPKITDFGRLSFINTLLSKRKLTTIINENNLTWEDPRIPTLRGLKNRGMDMGVLMEYITNTGMRQKCVVASWDKAWAENRKYQDLSAVRIYGIDTTDCIEAEIINWNDLKDYYNENNAKKNNDLNVDNKKKFDLNDIENKHDLNVDNLKNCDINDKDIKNNNINIDNMKKFSSNDINHENDDLNMDNNKRIGLEDKNVENYNVNNVKIKSDLNDKDVENNDEKSSNLDINNIKNSNSSLSNDLEDLSIKEFFTIEIDKNKKKNEMGKRKIKVTKKLIIPNEKLENGMEITLMNLGNFIIENINTEKDYSETNDGTLKNKSKIKLRFNKNGSYKTTSLKIQWVSKEYGKKIIVSEYGDLCIEGTETFNKNSKEDVEYIVEESIKDVQKGMVVQVERVAFCAWNGENLIIVPFTRQARKK